MEDGNIKILGLEAVMAHSPVSSTLRKLRCKYGGSVLATWGKGGWEGERFDWFALNITQTLSHILPVPYRSQFCADKVQHFLS